MIFLFQIFDNCATNVKKYTMQKSSKYMHCINNPPLTVSVRQDENT